MFTDDWVLFSWRTWFMGRSECHLVKIRKLKKTSEGDFPSTRHRKPLYNWTRNFDVSSCQFELSWKLVCAKFQLVWLELSTTPFFRGPNSGQCLICLPLVLAYLVNSEHLILGLPPNFICSGTPKLFSFVGLLLSHVRFRLYILIRWNLLQNFFVFYFNCGKVILFNLSPFFTHSCYLTRYWTYFHQKSEPIEFFSFSVVFTYCISCFIMEAQQVLILSWKHTNHQKQKIPSPIKSLITLTRQKTQNFPQLKIFTLSFVLENLLKQNTMAMLTCRKMELPQNNRC